MNTFYKYISFIHKITLKKKNTLIIPLIWLTISLIFLVSVVSFELNNNVKALIFYIIIFIELLLTLLFSSIKSINIFKDLEDEGIELLTLSKAISRKSIIWGKTVTNFLFAFYWSIILAISNFMILGALKDQNIVALGFLSIPIFSFGYILFGNISSLIAYKVNAKVAITIPLVLFSPLVVGGTIISTKSTSTSNNIAYYLNAQYQNNPSGNLPNLEKFYLNNQKDTFYIIANGNDKFTLRQDQVKYLQEAYNYSKNSALEWQIYSYLSLPYQFVDFFNLENKNIAETFLETSSNNLSKYIFYKNQDTYTYNYDLNKNVNLKLYPITDQIIKKQDANGNYLKNEAGDDIIESRTHKDVYLVPGALKTYSQIENLVNTNLIYAREGAESFAQKFPEDKFIYSASDNLVGEIKWNYLKELLENKIFQYYSKILIQELSNELKEASLDNVHEVKGIIFRLISKYLRTDSEWELLKIHDVSSVVLNKDSLENRNIKTIIEKKIYIALGLIYYLYFTYNHTYIADAILFNTSTNNFDPHSINLDIEGFTYNLGGFSNYVAKQQIEEDENKQRKVVIRYEIEPSNNYVFQPVQEIWQVTRNNIQTVNKNYYFLIWIALIALFVSLNNTLYFKKDYK